jgi:uncharacterized membrane protein YuzA (DUF378 family)
MLNLITLALVIVGGLNWGLYAFDFNLVNFILGSVPMLEKAVYVLVAASGVFQAKNLKK